MEKESMDAEPFAARARAVNEAKDNTPCLLRFRSSRGSRSLDHEARSVSYFSMALTLSDVRRIAELARLDLAADEQALMLEQLNSFFRIVEQMSAVETSGVEPLYTPLAAVQEAHLRLRDDEVTERVDRDANQRSAPLTKDGLYLVPRVIE